jgi:hypothetical protein
MTDNNIIVLMENEKNTRILQYLGVRTEMKFGPPEPQMCMARWYEAKEKIYSFETFKLDFYKDELVKKNVLARDGIVIVIENLNTEIFNNIMSVIENNKNTPLLMLFIYGNEGDDLVKHSEDYIEIDKNKIANTLTNISNHISKKNCNNVKISMCKEHKNDKGINNLIFKNFGTNDDIDIIKSYGQIFKNNNAKRFNTDSKNIPDKAFLELFDKHELPSYLNI